MAENPDDLGFKKFFDIGPGGVTETYVQAAWGRLSQGKKVLFHDLPGSLEAAIQAAADAGRVHGPEDVRHVVRAHYAARAAALPQAREALAALPGEAAHALDPEPGPGPTDVSPGVPPPPPFVLPEHLAGKPDAALRAAQDAALASGLAPHEANAAGRAAAEYVLAHGTSPETVHKRELLRGTEAGLPPEEVVRLAREAGNRAAAAREAARQQPPAAAEAPPFALPLPPETPPAGGDPPWWDPALGEVLGAEPESPTPRWWDPFLGEVVEPGTPTGRPPAPAAPGAGQLAEAAALAEAEEAEGAGEPPGPAIRPGREATERPARPGGFGEAALSPFGGLAAEFWGNLLGPPGGAGFAEGGAGGGGGGSMVALLERIATSLDRLIDIVQAGGGNGFSGVNRGGQDFGGWDQPGYDDEDDGYTAASPSVHLDHLERPGKSSDASARPRKADRRSYHEEEGHP